MKTILLLAIAILNATCMNSSVATNSGSTHETQVSVMNSKTKVNEFRNISVAGPMNVILTNDRRCSVTVESNDQKAFDNLVVYVDDNTLIVTTKRGANNVNMDQLTVKVAAPTIEGLEMTGSGNLSTLSAFTAKDAHLEVTGSGNIILSNPFTCQKMNVEVTGSGNVSINKLKAHQLTTSITGSGDVQYNSLDVKDAVSEIAGSGNISMRGKVGHHTKHVAGSGDIDTLGMR